MNIAALSQIWDDESRPGFQKRTLVAVVCILDECRGVCLTTLGFIGLRRCRFRTEDEIGFAVAASAQPKWLWSSVTHGSFEQRATR